MKHSITISVLLDVEIEDDDKGNITNLIIPELSKEDKKDIEKIIREEAYPYIKSEIMNEGITTELSDTVN